MLVPTNSSTKAFVKTVTDDDSSLESACDDSSTVLLAKDHIIIMLNELNAQGKWPDQEDLDTYFTASATTAARHV